MNAPTHTTIVTTNSTGAIPFHIVANAEQVLTARYPFPQCQIKSPQNARQSNSETA
jgi:hypothetical protein